MESWRKWIWGILVILVFSFGFTGIVAGRLMWFINTLSDLVFIVVLLIVWLAGFQFAAEFIGRSGQRSLSRLLIGFSLLASIGVVVYERTNGTAAIRSSGWSITGIALFLLAAMLDGIAANNLGSAYAPVPVVSPDQKLVTHELYNYIRHPMYIALALVVLGLPLILRSTWGLLAGSIVLVPAIWLRIKQEEGILKAAFGKAYEEYESRVSRFIPWLF
jgi:protein-S-isoprenylcysteine O-methyltransferase Ste14